MIHIPIFLREIKKFFFPSSCILGNFTIVDCTAGEGGHTFSFLDFSSKVRVIALEIDSEQVVEIQKRRRKLNISQERLKVFNLSYSQIEEVVSFTGWTVEAILFDLGISS